MERSAMKHRQSTRLVLLGLALAATAPQAATINQTLCVSRQNKIMSDGQSIEFWGFTPTCGIATNGEVPGPPVVLGIGDTLNLTLSIPMMPMTTPMETMMGPYMGHTIHLHGADVPTAEDGVPEFGAALMGDTYTWTPTSVMGGSYMYHCHQHTVKHLEMGMYGPMIVRPRNAAGTAFLNQLTPDAATAYDVEQTYLFSSVDPAYHASTAVGDSTVFADYNPRYFLINGNEGAGIGTPATTLTTSPNRRVALRLIGLHSVSGTFSIRNSAGAAQQFTVHVQDGRQYPTPETVTSLDISPGQRYDIIFTTPGSTGAWYPQLQFKRLRDGSVYATAYGRVGF
jgi:FtsP/CotA-like multicopper oxidase with cupredoxin domain